MPNVKDARHHIATRVVFVEVPAAGSPAPLNQSKPRPFKRNQWSPWRPQTRPPNRKAEAVKRLLRGIAENDQAAREFMAEARQTA
jgi:hypothetical protein